MSEKKDAVVAELIRWHFNIEPQLRQIVRILSENEDDPKEPIKLLEVNAATFPTGSVEPFGFAPSAEVPCFTTIAEITPEEFDLVKQGEIDLPTGWSLARATPFLRPTGT